MEQGGLAETKGNQLQNFLKAERGDAGARSAGRAGSCLRRWGRGRQPGPCPPLSRSHHDQRDPEEELQQAGPAEPHQVRAHLPAGARTRLAAACRGAPLPGGRGWGYRGKKGTVFRMDRLHVPLNELNFFLTPALQQTRCVRRRENRYPPLSPFSPKAI